MIDTHCHLCDEAFKDDIEEVVTRALASGVHGMVVLAEDQFDVPVTLDLQSRFSSVINIGFGVHPLQKRRDGSGVSRSATIKDLDLMRELIAKHYSQLVAIGEVGLDFTPSNCPTPDCQASQRAVLFSQVRLAKQLDLPLNVHSRSASEPTIELLKSEGATRVQMHAFDGRPSQALVGVACGYYFSIPPCVVRSRQKQELVKMVPLTSLLLETDSPVLGVTAKIRNEPAEIIKACEFIAATKGVDVSTVQRITSENARKLYPNLAVKQYQ